MNKADMIARTEMAAAQTRRSLEIYQSLGHEGKEWLTAGDGLPPEADRQGDRLCGSL